MAKGPNPSDVVKLGSKLAAVKASLPRKQWASFVKLAHARGHTIAGELSDNPAALKERTAAGIRKEAGKTIAAAYEPAEKSLSQREAAIGFLNEKRKTDDAAYRTWLTGETDKLNAQARAADATLTSQQSTIATETKTAIDAARADSLKRMAATPGNVSDPTQSTALDTSAADTAATKHIAAAREQSAGLIKIGEDSRTLATASVLGQQTAREGTRQAEAWKAISDLGEERTKINLEKGGALADKIASLTDSNVKVAQANREADLAAASLNLKADDSAQAIVEANRKYKLETAKFGLEQWKADNKAKVDQAKLDMGYAGIKAREGTAAADRALRLKLENIRSADRNRVDKDKPKGVTKDERGMYDKVVKAQGLFTRWAKNNAVPLAEREQHLLEMGFDAGVIQVAHDLARNSGVLSSGARVQARKLGIIHSGYFWPVTESRPH